jgi:hypothetical protein
MMVADISEPSNLHPLEKRRKLSLCNKSLSK